VAHIRAPHGHLTQSPTVHPTALRHCLPAAASTVDLEAGEEDGMPKDPQALVTAFGRSDLHTALYVVVEPH
jgi:hypothetical protein